MRRKKCLLPLLTLLFACTACTVPTGQSEPPEKEGYEIYFVSDVRAENGERVGSAESGALGSELRELSEGIATEAGLLELLMAGPRSADLTSPFPEGVTVRAWSRTENRVTVDLSEGYNGLAGIDLTLADSCIVLTLCQLDYVDEVYITVEGFRRPFRDRVYTAADFVENNRDTPQPSEEVSEEDGGEDAQNVENSPVPSAEESED